MFLTFLVLALFSSPANADNWAVKTGTLTFKANHFFKNVVGVSKEPRGLIRCEKKKCDVLVAVKLDSFDSENSSRDTHMRETMKAGEHPIVEVRAETKSLSTGSRKNKATVKLAGLEHIYVLNLQIAKKADGYRVTTNVPFKLSDFMLDAPSLLGTAIEDLVPVDVVLEFAPKAD